MYFLESTLIFHGEAFTVEETGDHWVGIQPMKNKERDVGRATTRLE